LNSIERTRWWRPYVEPVANRLNLAVDLVLAIICQESGGQPYIESRIMNMNLRTGELWGRAQGLMQLMPPREALLSDGELSEEDKTYYQNPARNIEMGCALLRGKIDAYGSEQMGVRAYFGLGTDAGGATDSVYLRAINELRLVFVE
jgi:soluble lytic murein transglycosylase-like protein